MGDIIAGTDTADEAVTGGKAVDGWGDGDRDEELAL